MRCSRLLHHAAVTGEPILPFSVRDERLKPPEMGFLANRRHRKYQIIKAIVPYTSRVVCGGLCEARNIIKRIVKS